MALLLTDRTRYLTGLAQCRMKRYLAFHAGPYGYGFQRKSTQIPLATGTYVHAALAGILLAAKELDGTTPPRTTVRKILAEVLSLYQREVQAAAFATVAPEDVQAVLQEQFALVRGLVWAWVRVVLPGLLEEFEVVDVEREEILVFGCDCESGGPVHDELCQGVRQMTRPDVVLRRKDDGKLTNHDFKTISVLTEQMVDEYRDSVQMGVGSLAVERRASEPVDTYYIHPLIKGQRKNDYDPDTKDYSGPKRQNSVLCYVYHRPANPPLYPADYQAKWKYVGEDGKNHTLGRAYTKVPVWEAEFSGKPQGVDNSEHWVGLLPKHVLEEMFALIGPYPRQTHLIEQYEQAMPAEEHRWSDDLWTLYHEEVKHGWASPEFQKILSRLVPRSYACFTYGSRCPFYDICITRGDASWKDPLASGKFVPRRPHHQLELDEMLARGIPLPESEETEEVA